MVREWTAFSTLTPHAPPPSPPSLPPSERFGDLTSTELLRKVNLLPKTMAHQRPPGNPRDSVASTTSTSTLTSVAEVGVRETAVEKLAYRFNQVKTCTVATLILAILSYVLSHECHMTAT